MENITIEELQGDSILQCKDLCNELMEFQQAKAVFHPECFDGMSFDTRMLPSYQGALRAQVLVAKVAGEPVGYVFSTIDEVEENARRYLPEWAPVVENSVGFYPDWLALPCKVGCLSNLYLRDAYRGSGLGHALTTMAMEWLGSFEDCSTAFVFISNGNDSALRFYQRHGFSYSHEVYGGFIHAAVCNFTRS